MRLRGRGVTFQHRHRKGYGNYALTVKIMFTLTHTW